MFRFFIYLSRLNTSHKYGTQSVHSQLKKSFVFNSEEGVFTIPVGVTTSLEVGTIIDTQGFASQIGTQTRYTEKLAPMKMTNYITLINKTYYFRARFPQDVVDVLGRKELKRSLRTDSYSEAVKRFPPVMQEYQNMVEGAERQQDALSSLEPLDLTDGEIMGLAANWVKENQTFQPVLKLQQTNSEDIAKRKETIANYEERIRPQRQEQLAINNFGSIVPQVRRQLKKAGVELDLDNLSHLRLCQTMLRAVICLEEKAHNERKGQFNTSAQDNILQLLEQHEEVIVSQQQGVKSKKVRTLRELIDRYTEERKVLWKPSTASSNKTSFDFLEEALGSDIDISTIERDVAHDVLDLLKQLPMNWKVNPELKGLSLKPAITKGKALGLQTISASTINSAYLRSIKPMFEWAKKETWLTFNAFDGLLYLQSAVEIAKSKVNARTSIPMVLLQELFNGNPWVSRNESYKNCPSFFWGPLVALYHGCRVSEVASLLVTDFVEDKGIHAISFSNVLDDNDFHRSFKSANTERVVPMHPELLRMGFLQFIQRQRQAGHRQLFPEHKASAKNMWGRKLTGWFNKHLKGVSKEPTACTFHSFRHNFQDALRDAGLHGTAEGQALSGRTATFSDTNKNADTVADGYGTRFKVSKLAPLIAKVQHEGLDLSHLYVDEE